MADTFKVLVCGGRDFKGETFAFHVLDTINAKRRITHVISGDAPGADTLGRHWAMRKCKIVWFYPADWTALGKRAGPIRNRTMLEDGAPDLVVAFPGGKGTANMVSQARKKGVEVQEVFPPNTSKGD